MSPQDVISQLDSYQRVQIERVLHGGCTMTNYPWTHLADKPFLMLGYGSLLSPESARKTIPDTPAEGHAPVVAFGLKRIFNYKKRSWKSPAAAGFPSSHQSVEVGKAALNCERCSSLHAVINARVIDISMDCLADLRKREAGYDLVQVPVLRWPIAAEAKIEYAYALCAPKESHDGGESFVDDNLLPDMPYTKLCCDGAALEGQEFLELFEKSCYLGDGQTTLEEYLRENPI